MKLTQILSVGLLIQAVSFMALAHHAGPHGRQGPMVIKGCDFRVPHSVACLELAFNGELERMMHRRGQSTRGMPQYPEFYRLPIDGTVSEEESWAKEWAPNQFVSAEVKGKNNPWNKDFDTLFDEDDRRWIRTCGMKNISDQSDVGTLSFTKIERKSFAVGGPIKKQTINAFVPTALEINNWKSKKFESASVEILAEKNHKGSHVNPMTMKVKSASGEELLCRNFLRDGNQHLLCKYNEGGTFIGFVGFSPKENNPYNEDGKCRHKVTGHQVKQILKEEREFRRNSRW